MVGEPDPGAPALPEEVVLRELCTAEAQRVTRVNTVAVWHSVAVAWHRVGRSYPAAYARWRQTEAALADHDHAAATAAVRAGYPIAVELGAMPLIAEFEALARHHRVDLTDPDAGALLSPVAARPDNPFGLTPREMDILRELCDGRTNRQIASNLFTTEKTASVHVSNILPKMHARSRGEAAAIARRLRMFPEADG